MARVDRHTTSGETGGATGHETSDVSLRGLLAFLAVLLTTGAVIFVLVWGLMFSLAKPGSARKQPVTEFPAISAPALAVPESNTNERRRLPEPLIEVTPASDLRALREREDRILDTWTSDPATGTTRMPIERAMELLVSDSSNAPSTPTSKPAAPAPAAPEPVAPEPAATEPKASLPSSPGRPADILPPELRDVGIDQHLDAQLPLDVTFADENSSPVTLGRYAGQRPIVLTFVYYDCPLLCSQVLSGIVRGLRPLRLEAGKDFDVVAVSFDPRDTPARAFKERSRYVSDYGRSGAESGFHFLTGADPSIHTLTSAAGFRYSQDPATGLFRHGAVVIVTTPDGRVSRYLPGIDFAPRDLQLAIVEASDGRIGTLSDRILLYCYQYDPASGRYGLLVMRLLRIGATAVVAALGLLIGHTWWRESGSHRRVRT